jgi:hypothetical protein
MQIVDMCEQVAEGNIWTQKGRDNRDVKTSAR